MAEQENGSSPLAEALARVGDRWTLLVAEALLTTFEIMQSPRSTAGPADRSNPDRNPAGPGQRPVLARAWGFDRPARPGRAHCGDQAPQRTVERGFTPDDAPGNSGCMS